MQRIFEIMCVKAKELLADGTVNRVLGWKRGQFAYDETPAVFGTEEELKEMVYDDFSGANLSKYLVAECKKEGRILVFLKPCDTYSFNQLIKEHKVDRNKVYVIGVECRGKVDINKIRDKSGNKEDSLLEKCRSCKGKAHAAYDELILTGEDIPEDKVDRFVTVSKLENMTADERYEFWRGELSKCIRCNACRNVCPSCTCIKCIFDNDASGVAGKANTDTFEENMFHIIRAYHVAGRCTDCGECTRVCPQHIPLHLLNRKFIKDINEFYGEYQAGADPEAVGPLTFFTKDDVEPAVVTDKGGSR